MRVVLRTQAIQGNCRPTLSLTNSQPNININVLLEAKCYFRRKGVGRFPESYLSTHTYQIPNNYPRQQNNRKVEE